MSQLSRVTHCTTGHDTLSSRHVTRTTRWAILVVGLHWENNIWHVFLRGEIHHAQGKGERPRVIVSDSYRSKLFSHYCVKGVEIPTLKLCSYGGIIAPSYSRENHFLVNSTVMLVMITRLLSHYHVCVGTSRKGSNLEPIIPFDCSSAELVIYIQD